jgi:DnaB-like helicase C terminal domain
MSDDDWTRIARRMSEISEAPFFIDDSPNPTMMNIRAKSRRLAQKAGLAADRHRLPAADDVGKKVSHVSRKCPILQADQAFGEGARGSGGDDEPV